ncbi:hypothetical protein lerEdw1_021197 [Lerista edwardsae]|nr:hypothetical protein lerEdw1_021199 [Lerista edwardsae]KAJ6651205.1 hypothetical protein lerEdw1_021197 [Lerista edwardsae]
MLMYIPHDNTIDHLSRTPTYLYVTLMGSCWRCAFLPLPLNGCLRTGFRTPSGAPIEC